MYKKRVIHNFNIKNEQGFQSENLKTPCEVQFPPRSHKQQIYFLYQGKEICLDLIFYRTEEVKRFQFRENKYFDKENLIKLSNEFSFDVIPDPLYSVSHNGIISNVKYKFDSPLMGLMKKTEEHYFLMIFNSRGTTNFEDDIIYVYGLWEVNLPKKIEFELFKS